MFFSHLLITAALSLASESSMQGVVFTPKPKSCVSLHEGRECYATIEISWQTAQVKDYCLFVETRAAPLKCWKDAKTGHLEYNFVSAKSLAFQLRSGRQQTMVAETKVSVGWVYNSSNKKRRWRIF